MNKQKKPDKPPTKDLEVYNPYGDLTELNGGRDLLDTVGKETLERIVKGYLDLLETSAAIYEADGSYATALFSSSYCRFMDSSSRLLSGTADNADAIASGKWLCHESCWTDSSRIAIETAQPYDLKSCHGGISIYAVPIKAFGKVVGALNCGYGTPPDGTFSSGETIDELVEKYKVSKEILIEVANEYKPRQEHIIEAVKRQLILSAELIGEIYERNKLTARLSEKEEQFHTAFEFSTIGIAITSPQKGWIRVNDEICRMMGYTREELMLVTWADLTHPDDLQSSVAEFNRMLTGEIDGYTLNKRYLRKDGTVVYTTLWVNCKRGGDGKVEYFISMLEDITGRRKMEEELRLQSEIIMNMEEGVVLIKADDGTIVYANPKFNRMFGYEDGELTGRSISVVNAPISDSNDLSPDEMAEQIQSVLKQTGSWQGELVNIKKDGTLFWCQAIVATFKHNTYGTVWISTHQDITKRKEAEKQIWETSERLRAIIDNSTAVIFLKDTEGKYLLINSQFEKLFKAPRAEIIGKTVYDLFPIDVAGALRKNDDEVLSRLIPMRYIENVPNENETHVYLSIKFPLFDANGRAYGVCGIATDITELKKMEDSLRKEVASRQTAEVLLKEKEVLLQEIHHRVKNNLQVVSGLLGLQMEYVLDPHYREMFMESQNRIRSIALVHEKLYRSKGFADVDIKEYVTDLANELFMNFTVDKNNVMLNLDIESIPIGIDVAIPCGLIINELFTNVLKHAFPRGCVLPCEIGIVIRSIDASSEMVELIVRDNGIGFPQGLDFRKTKTLGMHIILTLVKQLAGTIELTSLRCLPRNEGVSGHPCGTEFRITFRKQSVY